jgi:hypothetical protein
MVHRLTVDLHIVARVAAFCLGGFFLYAACFLFEDEEGQWQNRLEALWVTIHDRARITDSTFTAIVSRVADAVGKLYDRIFGRRLISFRAVGVSVNLSLVAVSIMAMIGIHAQKPPDRLWVVLAVAVLVSVLLTLLQSLYPNRLTISLVWSLFIGYVCAALQDSHRTSRIAAALSLGLLISVISDIFLILWTRWALASVSKKLTVGGIFRCIVRFGGYTCILALLPLPVIIAIRMHLPEFISFIFVAAILFDFSTAMLSLIPVLALLVVLAHRVFWPAVSRLVYPLARYGIFKSRKLLGAASGVCFSFAFGAAQTGLKDLLKLLG